MAQYVWASSLQDIRAAVARWRAFYEAERNMDLIVEEYKKRCLRPGYELSLQGFVYRNKIRAIVDKRSEAIPDWFSFEVVKDVPNAEELKTWIADWLEGPHFEDGRNLWSVLPDWNSYLERYGNLVLRMVVDEDGRVLVQSVPLEACDVMLDARDVLKVLAWRLTWDVSGVDPQTGLTVRRKVVEELDAERYRKYVDNELEEETYHNAGFIPVVHVAVNRQPGRFWGESVIEQLIEPQLWLAAVMTTIREVNRWMGWPLFAGTVPPSEVDIRPGGYTVAGEGDAFRVISWNVNPDSLYREMEEHLQDLYERGRVARKSVDALTASGNLPSGKALLILTQDGVNYIERVVSVLEEAMADLLYKAACLAGWLQYDPWSRPIRVEYPPLKLEDEAQRVAKAKVALEAYARGVLPKRLVVEALMDLGVIRAEEEPEEIVVEATDEVAQVISALAPTQGPTEPTA
ncbi:MAG: hypothetical protein QXU79_00160 [Candidatus Micrarchaeaceae archaeon]